MLYFSESEFSAEVKVLFGEYMKVYVLNEYSLQGGFEVANIYIFVCVLVYISDVCENKLEENDMFGCNQKDK